MKKVLLFTTVLFFGFVSSTELSAQKAASCQPGPACKATCTAAKGSAALRTTETEPAAAAVFTSLAAPGTAAQPAAKTPQCDPTQCDPSKCDKSKCDPAHCDPSKCQPAKCSGAHTNKL